MIKNTKAVGAHARTNPTLEAQFSLKPQDTSAAASELPGKPAFHPAFVETMSAATVSDQEDEEWVREALAGGLARQCRRETALVTTTPSIWRPVFEGAVKSVETLSPEQFLSNPGSYKTVVVLEIIDSTGEAESFLSSAWSQVAEHGRLVVVTVNEAAVSDESSETAFTRKKLKKLLGGFGKVRMQKEQPFRWLAMNVRKCDEGERELSDDVRNRYRVSAGLCRGRVLELGCGRGHLVHHASQKGCQVLGVDYSARKIEEARTRYPDLEFLVADILKLELPAEGYDTVLLPEILEHVDDSTGARMLERAWSWVAPGGRLVVSVPNEDCIPHPHHIRWFDVDALSAQLQGFGRPCAVVDQPYKWLLMFVDKPADPPNKQTT